MTSEERGTDAASARPRPEPPPERESTTEGRVAGIPYRATAATYHLRDEEGKVRAALFHVAYVRTDVEDLRRRPVTFAFNGGPGSSSVWLHLGLLGPRRVRLGDEPIPPRPPYEAVENEHTVLDLSDLVLIDPVTTGWSRPVEGEEAKEFHGLDEDARWVAEFIRLWLSRHRRWESPRFLVGESYGATRAAALSLHLADRLGIALNGVALISPALAFQTMHPQLGNDLPYVLFLPGYAATAWYHGTIDRRRWGTVRELTDEVEDFALGEYASVLLRGSRASRREREAAHRGLRRYTGLPADFLWRCDLRVPPTRFFKELLRDRRRTVGRLDSRVLGIDADATGERPDYDPSYALVQGVFTAAVNQYLRRDLSFDSDLVYETITERVQPWRWGEAGDGRYVEVASRLRAGMHRNRRMRVFVACGYYDLATPFAAVEWILDHMGLDPELRPNLTLERYEAGHMMYVHEPSARRLRADLGRWLEEAAGD
ncbi:MAG TPA: peptidase S10 [Candidatus Dormibacteraeota bacterium]|nr:peptidase S10 [Candidatus Dormibacteraeota bacterium]